MSLKKRIMMHTLFFFSLILILKITEQSIFSISIFKSNKNLILDPVVSIGFILAFSFVISYILLKLFEYNKLKFKIKINSAKSFLRIQKIIFNAFENLPIGIIILDTKGIIMYENKEVAKIFGHPKFNEKNPIVGVNILDIESIKSLNDTAKDALLNCLKNKKTVYNIESTFTSIYGKTIDIQISILPFTDDNNEHIGFIIVIQDNTAKNLYINRLIQKQKMETIGFLASGVAHEYNNVLGIIQGYIDLMGSQEIDEETENYITQVNKAIKRAKKITTQLLGYSKGKSGDNMNIIKIDDLINEVVNLIKVKFKDCKIKVYIEDKEEQIWGDKDTLIQVFLNIAINSVTAMEKKKNKEITISTKFVEINEKYLRLHPDAKIGKFINISFTDTGYGISKENLTKIFDPFFTKNLTEKKGTGLGLYMAYMIVKEHNGFVSVYSEKGAGTTFNVYLPLAPKKDIEIKEKNKSKNLEPVKKITEVKVKKILLVDDEEDLRNIFFNFLNKKKFYVKVAETGEQTLKILKENNFDIIILDYTLPDITGFELYYQIKESSPDIKIILMSGYGLNGKINTLIRDGLNKFIQKPFGVKKLLNAIEEISS